MKNNPKISIIIPVYNAEKFLDRCLDSVFAQSLTDYEVILVNDGSSDGSAAVCERYRALDSRVRYIEKENGGAGSARNAGMKLARGRYLAFPDADDWFDPDMYSELYSLADSGDYDMVFSGVNYYRQTASGVEYARTQNIKAVSFNDRKTCRENIMTFFPTTTIFDVPWNKLYKRAVVVENDIRFPDIRRAQDATFNIDFFNCVNSVASVEKAYYSYMENTLDDVRRKFPKDYINISIFYYTHLIGILTSWGVYSGDIKTHYDSSFVLSVYSTVNRYDNPRWRLSKSEQREYIEDILNRREITEFLLTAEVRDDVIPVYELVKAKDTDKIIKLHNKEKRKEAMRNNKLLVGVYRKLKGKKLHV